VTTTALRPGARTWTRRLRAAGALAVGALLLSSCGFKGLYSASLPGGADLGDHPYTITGYFADVLDLVPQSAVKVNDVAEGKVTAISLTDCTVSGTTTKQWCAKVKMKVNAEVKLPANSHAEIQQTSLLGEKYVALIAPSAADASSAPLRNGSQISFQVTKSAAEAEQVLGALSLLLNEGGLTQIQVIAQELNSALGTSQRQRPLARRDLISKNGSLQSFLRTLDRQKTQITTALDSINQLAGTLNEQKKVITDALDTFPAALRVLSGERRQLVTLLSSVSNLGGVASRVITNTQQQLVTSLKSLDPVVNRLADAGSALPKALRIAGTFPFPLGLSRQFVIGDYANLDAVLNLNLTDQLCGLLGDQATTQLCSGLLAPKGNKSKQLAADANSAATLAPMLVGAGK
jgi:phospholipid/cholesterol/gamma-HCH transport system substrate-binding protein